MIINKITKNVTCFRSNLFNVYNFSNSAKKLDLIITEYDVHGVNSLLRSTFHKRKPSLTGEKVIPFFYKIGDYYQSVCPYYHSVSKKPKPALMRLKQILPGYFVFNCLHCTCKSSKKLLSLVSQINRLFQIYYFKKSK